MERSTLPAKHNKSNDMNRMYCKGCVLQPSKVYLEGTPGVMPALGHIVLHDVTHKYYVEMQTTYIAAKPCSERREARTITLP